MIDIAIIQKQLLYNVKINMCTPGPNFRRQETPATRGPNLIELPNQSAKLVLRSPCLVANPLLLGHFELVGSMKQVLEQRKRRIFAANPLQSVGIMVPVPAILDFFSVLPHHTPRTCDKSPPEYIAGNVRPCFNVGLQDQGLRKHALVELLLKNRLVNKHR